MKTCTRCGLPKPLTAFRIDKRRNAYHCWCKQCHAEYNRQYRAEHPEYFRQYMKRYWQTHRRPRKRYNPAKRAEYHRLYMQRRRARHEAIARGQSVDYAADKRRRFAAILAEVGK